MSRYRVRRLETLLPASMPPLDTLAQFTDFLRSDHARFWYSNELHARRSFSSLLVTDTGEPPGHLVTRHTTCPALPRPVPRPHAALLPPRV